VTSPFALALQWLYRRMPLAQTHVASSVTVLEELLQRLRKTGLSEGVEDWLGGELEGSFYEFQMYPVGSTGAADFDVAFKDVDVAVTKVYNSSGLVTIGIVHGRSLYLALRECGGASGELAYLDPWVPRVDQRGRGFCVFEAPSKDYSGGRDGEKEAEEEDDDDEDDEDDEGGKGKGKDKGWPELSKVLIWQDLSAVESDLSARKMGTGSLWEESVAHQVASIRIDAQGVSPKALDRSRVLNFNRSLRSGSRVSEDDNVSIVSEPYVPPAAVSAAAAAKAEKEEARLRAERRAQDGYDSEESRERELAALRAAPKVKGRTGKREVHMHVDNDHGDDVLLDDALKDRHKARLGTRRQAGLINISDLADLQKK